VIVKQLKGASAIRLREQVPELTYLRYPHRWKQFKYLLARGYYYSSAGHLPQDAVKW
jgi:REP element-mobilizing transposase RayT